MAKLTKYELERQANMERNSKLLKSLGIDSIKNTMQAKPKPPPNTHKRKSKQIDIDEKETGEDKEAEGRPRKAARVEEADGEVTLRRSSRNAGKKFDYTEIEQDRSARSYRVSKFAEEAMARDPRSINKRTQDPKQYGHIPGVEVGAWWETREACSADAVHAPWVGGISCGPKGAYSIALSGGYDDDIDLGNGFTYTGSGGRDLKGTKDKPKNLRTAPQSSDQTFENNFNKALKISSETKRPVRVIRGYKLRSPFAPVEGYRYDGLYTVEKAWREIGVNSKYMVCKFAFKRLPGQPPLSKRYLEADTDEDTASDEDEDESRVASTQEAGSSTLMDDDDDDDDDDAEGEVDEQA